MPEIEHSNVIHTQFCLHCGNPNPIVSEATKKVEERSRNFGFRKIIEAINGTSVSTSYNLRSPTIIECPICKKRYQLNCTNDNDCKQYMKSLLDKTTINTSKQDTILTMMSTNNITFDNIYEDLLGITTIEKTENKFYKKILPDIRKKNIVQLDIFFNKFVATFLNNNNGDFSLTLEDINYSGNGIWGSD